MRNKKSKLFPVIFVLAAGVSFLIYKMHSSKPQREFVTRVRPVRESISRIVSTTAMILPKNRLEVKPPVSGRIEAILIKEGDKVKSGDTIAWMSSTERAALLDAARAKGEEELKYWEEAYKPIPLISPITGEIIVATTQPGQTVTTAEAVIVLSDQLIVRAQVDETDIGKIKLGQDANISLDAYPDTKIKAVTEHIYYESKTVNSVTIYEVDLRTESVPEYFRSGMNASVNFIVDNKENALVIPMEAIFSERGEDFVLVEDKSATGTSKPSVKLGIQEDKRVEVISGLSDDDTVIMKSKKYVLPKADEGGTNPFMPQRRREQR